MLMKLAGDRESEEISNLKEQKYYNYTLRRLKI